MLNSQDVKNKWHCVLEPTKSQEIPKCYCVYPCFRFLEGHCGGTEYEFNHHCEKLFCEGIQQRKRFDMNLADRNNN